MSDPVYFPNSIEEAPAADVDTYPEQASWAADGDMVRAASTAHPDDDDVSQPRALINEVMDDVARDRLVANVAGHVAKCTRGEVIERVFAYWRNIDPSIGDRIEAAVKARPA